jgi:hypothetical protein
VGKTFDHLDQSHIRFIEKQKLFFVATAPASLDGHVNLSPKGYDSFRVLGPNTVAYCDIGGTGVETVAHLRENKRITIMFCAFEGPAKVLRLYGEGRVIQSGETGFPAAMEMFPNLPRSRAVILIDVTRIADSCGYAVPIYKYQSERDQLSRWIEFHPEHDWEKPTLGANAASIDGLPALMHLDEHEAVEAPARKRSTLAGRIVHRLKPFARSAARRWEAARLAFG